MTVPPRYAVGGAYVEARFPVIANGDVAEANFVSVAKASSPVSRITTRVSEPASPAIVVLFMIVMPRCAAYEVLP